MPTPRPLLDDYDLYIGGRWIAPDGGRYDDINPATGASIATAPDAGVDDVGSAIAVARETFDSGEWASTSASDRARCIRQLGAALLERADEWYALAQAEWGCTLPERMYQVEAPAFVTDRLADLTTQLTETEEQPWGAAGRALMCHEPLGVVSVLTPWNFPHMLNAMKVVGALAAGNTVVLKPSPLTPVAALALARVVDEYTDIPAGVLNVVTPSDLEASRLLTTDPRVDMVSFTGSTAVGRQVMAAASQTMKRLLLECGGKSVNLVLPDTEITEEFLRRVLFESCTMHAGQACILNSRLLLPESLHDEVIGGLVELARDVRVGDPTDAGVEMGPLISNEHLTRVAAMVDDAISAGATLAAGGRRPPELQSGWFYEPTILTDADPDSRIAQEEVFGPVVTVLQYRDDDDAVAIANNSRYGLAGGVWGADTDRALGVARRIRTGHISVNGCGPGDLPFGGFKESGLGREGGMAGIRAYMEPKAIGIPG